MSSRRGEDDAKMTRRPSSLLNRGSLSACGRTADGREAAAVEDDSVEPIVAGGGWIQGEAEGGVCRWESLAVGRQGVTDKLMAGPAPDRDPQVTRSMRARNLLLAVTESAE